MASTTAMRPHMQPWGTSMQRLATCRQPMLMPGTGRRPRRRCTARAALHAALLPMLVLAACGADATAPDTAGGTAAHARERRLHAENTAYGSGTGGIGGRSSGTDPQSPGAALRSCVNDGFQLRAATWQDGTTEHSRLWLEHIWEPAGDTITPRPTASNGARSTAPHGSGRIDITIYTTLTMSRLEQLEQQCLSWLGPLSAAVYLPLLVQGPMGSRGGNRRSSGSGGSSSGSGGSSSGSGGSSSGSGSSSSSSSSSSSKDVSSWYVQEGATLALPPHARQTVTEAVAALDGFASSMAAAGRCALTLGLYWELFGEAAAASYMFPINTLRNYAALMARTDLVAMVDVDLALSYNFVEGLAAHPERVAALEAETLLNHSMMVLPPFEAFPCLAPSARTVAADGDAAGLPGKGGDSGGSSITTHERLSGKEAGILAAHASKTELWQLFRAQCVTIFHCQRGTHWYHNYTRWFRAAAAAEKEGSVSAIEIPYGFLYEPWFIGHRALVPMYDVRFKGFGYNKQLQILQLVQQRKYRLMLLTDAWLVHLPHSYSTSARAFHKIAPVRARRQGSSTRGRKGRTRGREGVGDEHGRERALLWQLEDGRKEEEEEEEDGQEGGEGEEEEEGEFFGWQVASNSGMAAAGLQGGQQEGWWSGSQQEGWQQQRQQQQQQWQQQEQQRRRQESAGREQQRRLLGGPGGGANRAEEFKAHIEGLFWSTHRSMRRDWAPELDARTRACLRELPWWAGYTEHAAVDRMLAARGGGKGKDGGQSAKRPPVPQPLPHISHDHFVKVLRPQLFKCPKTRD